MNAEINGAGIRFKEYFEVAEARTDALRDEVYRIRHEVYCEDLAFEPQRADRRETDEYDVYSLHVLMRSVQTGEFMGCARVIQTRMDDRDYPLPFEKACAGALDRTLVDPAQLPRHAIGEVSRLAVVGRYRRRKGEQHRHVPVSEGDFGTLQQPRFPYILIGLYLGAVEIARQHGIEQLFVLTEERLASHFRKLGVDVQTIGTPIEHRGVRIPSLISVSRVIEELKPVVLPMYRAIAADLERR